ncbi:MAG: hypothetical protein NWE84_00630 [Candidatus Bathyarchaeota archaeon]|nr:hypothetical protein [Candidatus Bathyarchaeota archaeon]
MQAEFEKRFREIISDPTLKQKLAKIVSKAGTSFNVCPVHRNMNAKVTNALLNGSEPKKNLAPI